METTLVDRDDGGSASDEKREVQLRARTVAHGRNIGVWTAIGVSAGGLI